MMSLWRNPLILAGLAVALLPSLNLARRHPGVTVRELPHAPPGRNVWCVRPSHQRLPVATAMISEVVRPGDADWTGESA